MTNLDSVLKSKDITLPTKDHLVKAMVFPVVMIGWAGVLQFWGSHELDMTEFMANRWGNNGKSDRLFFPGLQNHCRCRHDCRHEIKRCLLLGRKAMISLDSILKSRDIILPTKVSIVKAMVFLVVMYRCESWTIKKAEH